MFLFRMFKRFLFLAIFAGLVFWVANYKVGGKPLYQIAKNFLTSSGYQEGIKDLKMFFGGLLKTFGEQIQEDVSEKEKKEFENLIKEKMKEGNRP